MDRETVKISALRAAPYNPRTISKEAAEGLTKSLQRWGVVQEVVANRRTGHIVGGHQRVAALKKMGVKEVPVVWVDLDDVEEKALNVALNNPHISGEFDDTIAGLLAEIRDGIGPDDFEALKLDDLLPPDAENDEHNTESQIGGLEYRVVIENLDELTQEELVSRLTQEGYTCKAMMS